MESGKTKEDILQDLIRMQRNIRKGVEAQERFIRGFQLLVQREGLSAQAIDHLPFPVAIFEQNGVVRMANNILMKQAKIETNELSQGKVNLLDRVTNENYAVFAAAEDTFCGKITMARDLLFPLTLFRRDTSGEGSDPYHTAAFFPVSCSGSIRYGSVMLMK